MKSYCLIFLLSIFLTPFSLAKERIIYGSDNRVETFEANNLYQKWAKSTAGMIHSIELLDIGSHYIMPPSSLGKYYGLCDGERFKEQPSPLICSGFLVGPDLLVTAGHCITNQQGCDEVSWVFDFKIDPGKLKAKVAISKENIFRCKKLIDVKLQGTKNEIRDYSLIQLDRSALSFKEQRIPLKYRGQGKIKDGQELVLIGHPSGLPQKISPKGYVYNNESKHFFKTNLDSFVGNSGSAVFNAHTGLVEGILVRGATDFIQENCGTRVNQVNEDKANKDEFGEFVSRITDIDGLQIRDKFLNNVRNGVVTKVKEYLKTWDTEFLIKAQDEKGNSALHLAIINGGKDIFDFILNIGKPLNLNLQNKRGETPLHLAAFVNNSRAIRVLVKHEANALIKDNIGDLPSQRTSYFSFSLRSFLRKYEANLRSKVN